MRTGHLKTAFYYGYVIVAAALLIKVMIWGVNYSFGIFFKPMTTEFGWTRGLAAGAFSLAILVEGVGSLVMGRVNDRIGPRLALALSGLIFGLGFFLMSRITSLTQLYLVYGGLIGLTLGGCYIPLTATLASWFERRRGMMLALVAAGVSLGTMVASPIANGLILKHGWRSSFVIFGLLGAVGICLGAQLLRRGPETLPDSETRPGPKTEPEAAAAQADFKYRIKFNRVQFGLLSLLYFSWAFCKYVILVHLAPHITDLGLSPTTGATTLAVIGGGSFCATLLLGWGTLRLGTKKTFVLGLTLTAAALIWLVFAHTVWGFYLFGAVFSFGFSCGAVLVPTVIAEMFGLRGYGSLLGLVNFAACIGCAAGPIIAGHLFDTTGSYDLAFMLIAAMAVVNVGLVLLLKVGQGGEKVKEKAAA